jgi:hypothetical protein
VGGPLCSSRVVHRMLCIFGRPLRILKPKASGPLLQQKAFGLSRMSFSVRVRTPQLGRPGLSQAAEKHFVRRARLQPRRECHARDAALATEVRFDGHFGIEKTYPRG